MPSATSRMQTAPRKACPHSSLPHHIHFPRSSQEHLHRRTCRHGGIILHSTNFRTNAAFETQHIACNCFYSLQRLLSRLRPENHPAHDLARGIKSKNCETILHDSFLGSRSHVARRVLCLPMEGRGVQKRESEQDQPGNHDVRMESCSNASIYEKQYI